MSKPLFSLDPRHTGCDDLAAVLRIADELGIPGVEWSVLTTDDVQAVPMFDRTTRLATIRVALLDLKDPETEPLIGDVLRVAVERECLLVTGPAGIPPDEHARPTFLDRLRRIGRLAEALGCVYALECGPGLCQSHRHMLDTLRDVDSRGIGLSFDPVPLHAYNEFLNSEVALAKTCHAVAHVRLGDCSGEMGDSQRLPIGQGVVDFYRFGELLRVCGYRGPNCLSLPALPRTPAELRRDLTAALAHLRLCRWMTSP